jgi:hypothetical protein
VKHHELDPISLVAGLLFVFLSLFFLGGHRTASDLAWPWTLVIPLLALGLLAVLMGLRRVGGNRPVPAPAIGPTAGAEPEPPAGEAPLKPPGAGPAVDPPHDPSAT